MKNFLMLAALGAIFGISFSLFQQPSSNVNQPSTEPVAETQPVQQPPSEPGAETQHAEEHSEPGAETQHAEEHSELITKINPVQPPSKPEEGTYNNPCAQQNNCNPTIEEQVRELGRQIDPSIQVKKLDPTSWGW
jgi:cytoskeletal protein RodZ